MSEDMQVNEATPEAAAPETDSMHAEMSQTFDRLNPEDGLSRVPNEAQVAVGHDYNVSEEPTESTEAPQEQIDGVKAPPAWNAKAREYWNNLPREMQEYVSQRELEAQQKISQQNQQLFELQRGSQSSMPSLAHIERAAQEHGLTTDDTLQRWAAADRLLKTNPEQAIQYLAQAHGIDLGKFGGSPQDQEFGQLFDQYKQQMEVMRGHYEQQVQQQRQEYAQWHQQQAQHLTAAISQFAEGKPYWPQIEPAIIQQIAAMKAVDPGRVQADPMGALREAEKLAIKISGIELPERKAEAKKKADEAKRLASLNVRSSSSSPNIKFTSMEEEMASVYERLHGRH